MRKHLKIEKHNDNCPDDNVRILYIRDRDDKGFQPITPYGLICTNCDSFEKTNFDPKFKSRIAKMEKEYLSDESIKFIEGWYGGTVTVEQHLKDARARAIIKKCKTKIRKLLGNEPITPKEQGLRKKLENLEAFYQEVNSKLDTDLGWDHELFRHFLVSRPTIAQLNKLNRICCNDKSSIPPGLLDLCIHTNNSRRRRDLIGYVPIPIPEKPGWVRFKRDKEKYIELLKLVIQTKKEYMHDLLNPSEPKEAIIITPRVNKKKRKILCD
jgi:hypothetical protein